MQICTKHKCKLVNSSVVAKSEQTFTLCPAESYIADHKPVIETDPLKIAFAQYMVDVFNAPIDFEKDINYVRSNYKPIKYKLKGNTRFMINSKNEFDILKVDNKYITVFYDLHNNNKVTSYQIIKSEVENSISNIYPMNNDDLKESFENQMIDLVNSMRYKYGLGRMNYCEKAKNSAVKHSEDMRNKNYFDHKNKNNESPFDRMKKENIEYIRSGENIAAGQVNAIYAHEALMNSLGHRKNILGNYDNIGVGVSFGGHYKIYYTQNFYSE